MTLWSPVFLLILTLLMGIGAWALFMWAVKSGQFDDIEGPKYRMFDDDDDFSPPGSEPPESTGHQVQRHADHDHPGQ